LAVRFQGISLEQRWKIT